MGWVSCINSAEYVRQVRIWLWKWASQLILSINTDLLSANSGGSRTSKSSASQSLVKDIFSKLLMSETDMNTLHTTSMQFTLQAAQHASSPTWKLVCSLYNEMHLLLWAFVDIVAMLKHCMFLKCCLNFYTYHTVEKYQIVGLPAKVRGLHLEQLWARTSSSRDLQTSG